MQNLASSTLPHQEQTLLHQIMRYGYIRGRRELREEEEEGFLLPKTTKDPCTTYLL
jgi:hypothetical protein